MQPTQLWVSGSQRFLVPVLQFASPRHATHRSVVVSQYGTGSLQSPLVLQAYSHVWLARTQVFPVEQWLLLRHATHSFFVVSQNRVGAPQSPSLAHFWTLAPPSSPAVP